MKIYTKTGDKGETSLLGSRRVKKNCLEIDAVGELDELNASIGLLISFLKEEFLDTKNRLTVVQNKLFVIGSNLASLQMEIKTVPKLDIEDTQFLEKWIDEMELDLEKLNNFILPSGSTSASKAFLSRAICRRAERRLIDLSEKYDVDELIKQYLNRLSDLLFVLGRWLNKQKGIGEENWEK